MVGTASPGLILLDDAPPLDGIGSYTTGAFVVCCGGSPASKEGRGKSWRSEEEGGGY